MTGYDQYVFILCIVSFTLTVSLFGVMLGIIIFQQCRAIDHGLLDKKITNEYLRDYGKKSPLKIVFSIISLILSVAVIAAFAWTFSVRFSDSKVEGKTPVPRVVLSDSMSYKRDTNTYLTEHNLNDQFDTFDLILTHKLPGEFELQLYDVVVYEVDGDLIVHRIVEIEEPNEAHPDHRIFRLRGDAVKYNDGYSVEYSDMKAIYRGEKVKFVGSFIYFLQSPAGYVCIVLLVFGFILAPLLDKFIAFKKRKRYEKVGFYTGD